MTASLTLVASETCACPPHVRYSCGHCWHDQCLDCGFCTVGGCVCHCEYGLGFTPGHAPADGPQFWLGAHHPRWLATTGVPLMVNRRSLTGRRSLPRAAEQWVLDSGGFTELSLNGGWTVPPHTYAREVARFRDEIGEHVEYAIDLARWSVDLGACGLKTTSELAWGRGGDAWDLAIQIAHRPGLNDDLRKAITAAVRGSVRLVLDNRGIDDLQLLHQNPPASDEDVPF